MRQADEAVQIACARKKSSSTSSVYILETLDIILPKITADLYFNEFKWYFSRIGEPVDGANGDVNRFVLVDHPYLCRERHFSNTLHDHPVLRAVQVLLQ